MKFVIRLNYNASIVVSVDANDEGQALDMAREAAENADIRQFSIMGENAAEVVGREE